MILVAGVGLAVVLVVLTGGRLSALARVRFRATSVLMAALVLQIIVVSVLPDRLPGLHEPVHLASYALLAVFFAANIRTPGVALMAAGYGCNFAAIAANGGVMPATPAALATAGLPTTAGFANSAAVPDARLPWLGDVFAVPAGWPLANVFSVGDVLLLVGAVVLLVTVCHGRGATDHPAALAAPSTED